MFDQVPHGFGREPELIQQSCFIYVTEQGPAERAGTWAVANGWAQGFGLGPRPGWAPKMTSEGSERATVGISWKLAVWKLLDNSIGTI